MRILLRTACALTFLSLPVFADDEQPPPDERQQPQQQEQTQNPPQAEADDPGPLRLSAFIADAAAAQRRARIVDGIVGIAVAGGAIATGGVVLAIPNQTDATKTLGWVAVALGGVGVLASAFGLFSRGNLELLDEAYAPFARDRNIPASKRVEEGEHALAQLAAAGKRSRIIGGATSLIIGAGFAIAAAPVAFAVVPETDPNKDTLRLYFGLAFGVSGLASIASGITQIFVRRTEAETLWSLWLAGTGRSEARRIQPFVNPIAGGGMGGITATF
jgi:hypothetical protein